MDRIAESLCWLGFALFLTGLVVTTVFLQWSKPDDGAWASPPERKVVYSSEAAPLVRLSFLVFSATGVALLTAGLLKNSMQSK